LIEAGRLGWSDPRILLALGAGVLTLRVFVAWERRSHAPMVPMRFFASRPFAAAGAASALAYFSFLGAFFLVAQLLQVGIGASPVRAGLELLVLTGAMVITAPAAGALCDRLGPRPVLIASLAVETLALGWLGVVASPGVGYPAIAPALALAGVAGAGLFAPIQTALLGAVAPQEQGKASGVATVIRELGGVLGVAVLGAVFAAHGSTGSADAFLAGFRPAMVVGAAVAAAGAFAASLLPRASRASRGAGTVELQPLPATD
jgi:MFS family permease